MLSKTALVIVHSSVEVARYGSIFPRSTFVFVPWGTTISIREELFCSRRYSDDAKLDKYIVTAGKSGRDYRTLVDAVRGIPVETRLICDNMDVVPALHENDNVRVLDHCFGNQYIRQLFDAMIVVVSLDVTEISAGQMVVAQAMALGKAVVVTSTAAIKDYVIDEFDAILVEHKSVSGLKAAIERLIGNPELRERLGQNALKSYETRLSTEAHVSALIEKLTSAGPNQG